MDYVNAFWVGGLICALAQILLDRTKMLPGRVMVLLVVLGAVISFFGWYEPFAEYAGAGANVPLLGYGNILMKGIKEAVDKMDYDEILRTTHTMKGIASNLEFTHLQQKSAKAVDMIRAGEKETVLPVIDEIEKEYQKVIEQIQKLD